MEADDLEKSSEEETQLETSKKKEYQICLKSVHKSRNKKIQRNIKNYRRLLLEEQSRLLQEQKMLQNRLQKYFNIESELRQFFSKTNINLSSVQKLDSQNGQIVPADFIINLHEHQ